MPPYDLARRAVAELTGTAFLVATVVGSGIMADRLTDDVALTLLCNALATGAILVVLIGALGAISGAHFNPAVSIVFALKDKTSTRNVLAYCAAQILGGLLGVMAAHLMYELPPLDPSGTIRAGMAQWLSEVIATFGLVAVILAGVRFDRASVPWMVGLYITAAYWFTASTSFANPAVAIARSMTDTFSGIRPIDVPAFVVAQFVGALLALALVGWLIRPKPQ